MSGMFVLVVNLVMLWFRGIVNPAELMESVGVCLCSYFL